ncbi:MAG TPA: DUF2135 domain-containing protein [Ideonella sp.]|uniref:YfaP family protein n=1 Tax=Ideonella sp. TaxID=1929293 RepID=UPI002E34DF7E|nr:DUF2135 domain-containing protein [Ideonella sp.]HEX5685499.1 DUF2135 domain-containing protein [Ideonella sp.]
MSSVLHRLSVAVFTCLGIGTSVSAQDTARTVIDTPAGGWRASDSTQRDFVQSVNYPASNVNAEGRSASARIAGRIAKGIAASTKADGRQPARLVVDGIALPLDVADDGRFARPWSFGPGAHGVSVRSGGGGSERRVQFYEANASRVAPKLRVVLSWDTDMTDIDLHVVSPDGQHAWYGERVAPNGGALDVDVTTGFGPEIYAHPSPAPGVYHVYVNYFGAGEQQDAITVAQVALVENEGTPREKQQVFRVPLRKPGELTLVRSFVVP